MKKKLFGILLSIVVLIVFLLVLAPARTIVPIVKSYLPPNLQSLQFGEISGSIWSPKFAAISYKQLTIQNVAIDISPFSLLAGSLSLHLSADDENLKLEGELDAQTEKVIIENLAYRLNAQLLDPFMKFPVKGVNGTIVGDIKVADFSPKDSWSNVQGNGDWLNANIEYLNNNLPLGDFKFQIATDANNNLVIEITENKGLLDIEGQLSLTPARDYKLNLTTSSSLPADLDNWIKKIARINNGRYEIVWNGKF